MLYYYIFLLKYPKAYFFEGCAFFSPFPLFPFTLTQPFFLLLG